MKNLKSFALVGVLALAVTACGGGGGGGGTPSQSPGAQPQKGGTLRIETNSDVLAVMDPQQEYYQISFQIYGCCLGRTLMAYNGLDEAHDGSKVFPDLAAEEPEVSSDGLTWTFHMKQGLHYAPPLEDVEITSHDIVRAVMRIATPDAQASYPFYFDNIVGFSDFRDGKADTISGLETPDDKTLMITTIDPAGDTPYRFSMPATMPIPPNPEDPKAPLGIAEGHNNNFGQFWVSSGPYMWEGSGDLDFSVPADEQVAVSGYEPAKHMSLVRNPSWAQDDLRPAYVNALDVTISTTAEPDVLSKKVANDEIDTMFSNGVSPQIRREFDTDPNLADRIYTSTSGNSNYYIFMNLAVPPFDDVQVRKAVNFAIDKAGYAQLQGGEEAIGPIYGHFAIDVDLQGLLQDYDPYATPDHMGADSPEGLDLAKAEMAKSTYDSDGDGICDAEECKDVLTIGVTGRISEAVDSLFTDNLSKIGIGLNFKHVSNDAAYAAIYDPSAKVPFATFGGWIHDYPDGYTWFYPLMYGPNILDNYNTNYSMVGATPEQLKKYGYDITSVPSMDDQVLKCVPLSGDERVQCWADADKYVMEQIVPIVPLNESITTNIISSRVTSFTFAAWNSQIAWDHISLAPGSD